MTIYVYVYICSFSTGEKDAKCLVVSAENIFCSPTSKKVVWDTAPRISSLSLWPPVFSSSSVYFFILLSILVFTFIPPSVDFTFSFCLLPFKPLSLSVCFFVHCTVLCQERIKSSVVQVQTWKIYTYTQLITFSILFSIHFFYIFYVILKISDGFYSKWT